MLTKDKGNQTITKVILYLRVSDPKQVKDGNGLDSQENRARTWAKSRGYTIIKVYREEGVSGAKESRPEFDAMLGYVLTAKEKFIILFDDESRIARDVEIFRRTWRILDSAGHIVATTKRGILDPKKDKVFATIEAVMAEAQRDNTRDKSMEYTNVRLQAGYWVVGNPARGYQRVRQGKNIYNQRREPAATIIQEALEGYAAGRLETHQAVLDYINRHPLFAESGMAKANHNFIRWILTSPVYTGWFDYPKRDIPYQQWKMDAIISRETYQIIQDRINGKYVKVRKYNTEDEVFPLRRQVRCSACGTPLTGSRIKGRLGGIYPRYHCYKKGCSMAGRAIRPEVIHNDLELLLAAYQPQRAFLRYIELKAHEVYNENFSGFRIAQQGKQNRIKAIESELENLSRAAMQTKSDSMRERYEMNYEELEQEKDALVAELETPINEPMPFSEALPLVFDFVSRPLEIWHTGSIKLKHGVLNFYFEDKLVYDRTEKFRTPKTSQILATLQGFTSADCDLACPAGFEPAVPTFGGWCSIQLSHGHFVAKLYSKFYDLQF